MASSSQFRHSPIIALIQIGAIKPRVASQPAPVANVQHHMPLRSPGDSSMFPQGEGSFGIVDKALQGGRGKLARAGPNNRSHIDQSLPDGQKSIASLPQAMAMTKKGIPTERYQCTSFCGFGRQARCCGCPEHRGSQVLQLIDGLLRISSPLLPVPRPQLSPASLNPQLDDFILGSQPNGPNIGQYESPQVCLAKVFVHPQMQSMEGVQCQMPNRHATIHRSKERVPVGREGVVGLPPEKNSPWHNHLLAGKASLGSSLSPASSPRAGRDRVKARPRLPIALFSQKSAPKTMACSLAVPILTHLSHSVHALSKSSGVFSGKGDSTTLNAPSPLKSSNVPVQQKQGWSEEFHGGRPNV